MDPPEGLAHPARGRPRNLPHPGDGHRSRHRRRLLESDRERGAAARRGEEPRDGEGAARADEDPVSGGRRLEGRGHGGRGGRRRARVLADHRGGHLPHRPGPPDRSRARPEPDGGFEARDRAHGPARGLRRLRHQRRGIDAQGPREPTRAGRGAVGDRTPAGESQVREEPAPAAARPGRGHTETRACRATGTRTANHLRAAGPACGRPRLQGQLQGLLHAGRCRPRRRRRRLLDPDSEHGRHATASRSPSSSCGAPWCRSGASSSRSCSRCAWPPAT